MGAKATFNPITRVITLTQAPVSGDADLNIQTDIYSDGKEDWVSTESLRRVIFPIITLGGQPTTGAEEVGKYFFIRPDWKIQPYLASHRLRVDGNFYATDGSDPFLDAAGYTVRIMQKVSNLSSVNVVSTGSVLTPTQAAQLAQAASNSQLLANVDGGGWEIINNQMIFYESDNTTEIFRCNLFNAAGDPAMDNVYKRERV